MKGRKPTRPQGWGKLRADTIYTSNAFMRETGLGRHSYASLRRQGLLVRKIGQRCFIDGQEALDFLRRQWQQPAEHDAESIQEGADR